MKSLPQNLTLSLFDGKVCAICCLWFPFSSFTKSKRYLDGHSSYCLLCRRVKNYEWYKDNRDKVVERLRRAYHNRRKYDLLRWLSDFQCGKLGYSLIPEPIIVTEKTCFRCKEIKRIDEFCRNKYLKDGFNSYCKTCTNRTYQENREARRDSARRRYQFNRVKNVALKKAYYQKNRERLIQYSMRWSHKNRERTREQYAPARRNWRLKNRDKLTVYHITRRTRKTAAGGNYTHQEWNALCSQYNYHCLCCGHKRRLTVDHIVPVSKGGNSNIENLQPLCASCNSKKGARIIDYRNITF